MCFSPAAGSTKLSGIAVGTNGAGIKIFSEFANGAFLKKIDLANGFTVSVDINYFNEDTIPDIVIPSYFAGSFSIFSGDSAGGFTPGESYSVEGHCTWIITADFNEDGKTDIAAGHNGSGQPFHLYIYLGNGDGTFTRFKKYPTQFATPTKIIAADVNNDTHIDILYSLSGPDCGMLFLGNGDGTFKDPYSIASYGADDVRGNSQGFTIADINSDGILDWIGAQDQIDSIVIRLGDGTGKFFQSKSLYMPNAWDTEAADLNKDGRIDIAVSNLDSVVCLLQDESGNFIPSPSVHPENG
ncbi:MAG TPA: VCBS repeat-containing protein, partial [Ignavibacteriaceae bacterium]|nr:VCBS repeat-containing protein [Ignavibacteriaceae bacterium]